MRFRVVVPLATMFLCTILSARTVFASDEELKPEAYSGKPICNTAEQAEMLTRLIIEKGLQPEEALSNINQVAQGLVCQIPDLGPL